MWDYEADAPFMWPKKQKYPTAERRARSRNATRKRRRSGACGATRSSLKRVSELNPQLKDTQFADYHGHGWNFRSIFKRDRKGTLVDAKNQPVSDEDPQKFKKAVHLTSVHLDVGMQCVDCHFAQDAHGNGHIYGEVAAAIEVDCKDCHGSASKYPTLFTSGPAARPGGMDMKLLRTQDGRRRFEWREGKLYQRSALDPEPRVGDVAGEGLGESRASELQPEGGPGQDHEHRPHPGLGRRGGPAELRPLR
jgi:hypothetical protein